MLPDPESLTFGGRFEHRSDLGNDKFCAVPEGDGRARIGVLAVFGSNSQCEARGTAQWTGEHVEIRLQGEGECRFAAHYDGVELQFPGTLPHGCANFCSSRASFAGVRFFSVESDVRAALATRGREFERLCPDEN